MTIIDIKRLDRYLQTIKDPFGTGFPILKKILSKSAERHGMSISDIVQKYVAWKWRR